jgi:hypothetical protein
MNTRRIDYRFKQRAVLIGASALLGMVLVGCRAADQAELELDPSLQVYRDRFLSATPLIGDVRTPSWVKDSAADPSLPPGEELDTTTQAAQPVLLIGRINAGEFAAFGKGEATFVLSEMPDESHAGDDPEHADNCPFCKKKLENAPKTIVRLEADDQSVLPIGADQLLGLSTNDVVVVQGTARFDETLNSVLMSAEKIYKK